MADSWVITYIETSAKTNFNCKESFEILAKDIIKFKNEFKKKEMYYCLTKIYILIYN